jgi:hypothetical protein
MSFRQIFIDKALKMDIFNALQAAFQPDFGLYPFTYEGVKRWGTHFFGLYPFTFCCIFRPFFVN